MHHFSLFSARRPSACLAAVLGVLVAASSLSLPERSAGQDPQNAPQATGTNGPSSYGPSADPSGGSLSGDNSGGGASSSDATGSTSNPPVGVDTAGHADAVATRNGRTTRQRVPATPANPLVLTDPNRASDTPSAYSLDNSYNPYGPQNARQSTPAVIPIYIPRAVPPPATGNSLIPPIVTRPPGDYTLQTNPALLGQFQNARPLPLFGYDFFQPARQIIVARRRSLLPAPPPVRFNTRTSTRPGQTPSTAGAGTPNSAAPNYNSNYNYNNGPNYNNATNYNSSTFDAAGSDAAATDPALIGAGALYGASGYGASGSVPAGTGQNGSQPPASSTDPGQSPGYPGTGSDANSSGASQNGVSGNYPNFNASGSTFSPDMTGGGNDPAQQQYTAAGRDPSQNSTPPYPNTQNPSVTQNGFPGDTAAPGGDIQFPGDDALVQTGAANAVTGQIADPISTLYKNVLASLPPNYELQPGDLLTVRYSALTLAPREFTATVDLTGGIEVEGAGRISVAGRTASQAENTLRQRLERLYRNVDVSISLRQLRTIQVTISGAAFAPGTYTVPSTATAFNILNAAGGPTADGSLRDIRVLRNGRLVGILDIYPLIGATSASPSAANGDISLQAGDNIYIPERLSRIAVRGEVRQQAIYELTPAETLRDALRYAGGVKPSGVDQNVHIDTINNGTDRVIRDVNLRDKAVVASVHVYDGDTVEVSSIRSILTNRVTITGAVDQPGDYALTSGLTVAGLIARARGVLYDTYLNRAELTRLNPDNTTQSLRLDVSGALSGDPAQNIPLKRFDILRLYTRQEVSYLGRRLVTVRGAVQRPGLYTQSDNMHVSDLLLDSGGPLPDAYLNRAVLLHQRGDGTYAYDYVSLNDVLSGDPGMDLPVQDNDVLAVYRIGEAHFTPDHTVKILGNVVTPGLYARGDGMRLSDLLKQAGAFKPGGGTRVTVAHARRPITDRAIQVATQTQTVDYASDQTVATGTDLVLRDGDVVAVQGDGNLQDHPAVVTVTGLVNRPGPIIIHQGMRLSDAVREAGGLRAEAFPQGAEFTRMSDALATPGQLDLAVVIARMSDLLNLSQYQRERAKANLALIEAAGSAASGSGGLLGGGAANASNPNLAPLIATLPSNNPVSPARLLTPSQLEPNGGVAVQLAQALKRPGSMEDVLLKDGDTLVVPETPTTVQVVGAVYSGRGVVYRPGQSIDYYIQLVGGFTPDAAKDQIEVIHAGGGLIPANRAGALQPGDLILVPTKVLAEKISRSGSGFGDFFSALLGSAISLKVLTSVFGI